jgi:hypothetical protein
MLQPKRNQPLVVGEAMLRLMDVSPEQVDALLARAAKQRAEPITSPEKPRPRPSSPFKQAPP